MIESIHMCREQGGTSLSLDWPTRIGGAAGHHHWSIPAASELMHCESTSSVFDLQSGGDLTGGKGGGEKAGGGRQVREGAERGAQSSVDGKCARTRMGKKGTVPYVLDGRFLHCRF